MIYGNVFDLKSPWNKQIPRENQNQWSKWTRNLHDKRELPRSIPIKEKRISYIDIHLVNNASLTAVCTVAYAVINQQKSAEYIYSEFNNQ